MRQVALQPVHEQPFFDLNAAVAQTLDQRRKWFSRMKQLLATEGEGLNLLQSGIGAEATLSKARQVLDELQDLNRKLRASADDRIGQMASSIALMKTLVEGQRAALAVDFGESVVHQWGDELAAIGKDLSALQIAPANAEAVTAAIASCRGRLVRGVGPLTSWAGWKNNPHAAAELNAMARGGFLQ
jgi:hypothetical protein